MSEPIQGINKKTGIQVWCIYGWFRSRLSSWKALQGRETLLLTHLHEMALSRLECWPWELVVDVRKSFTLRRIFWSFKRHLNYQGVLEKHGAFPFLCRCLGWSCFIKDGVEDSHLVLPYIPKICGERVKKFYNFIVCGELAGSSFKKVSISQPRKLKGSYSY